MDFSISSLTIVSLFALATIISSFQGKIQAWSGKESLISPSAMLRDSTIHTKVSASKESDSDLRTIQEPKPLEKSHLQNNSSKKSNFLHILGKNGDESSVSEESEARGIRKFIKDFWDKGFGFTKLWFYDRGEITSFGKGEQTSTYEESWNNRTRNVKDSKALENGNLDHNENSGGGDHVARWSNHGQYQMNQFDKPTEDVMAIISIHLNQQPILSDSIRNLTELSGNEPNSEASEVKEELEKGSIPKLSPSQEVQSNRSFIMKKRGQI